MYELTPGQAYLKALVEGPADYTRNIACREPRYAYYYAWDIDQYPRPETREGVLSDVRYTYLYARDVDRQYRKDTWDVVKVSFYYGPVYKKHLGNCP